MEKINEKRLEVLENGKKSYDIVIRESFSDLTAELELFQISQRKLCIVSDSNISSIYGGELEDILKERCAKLVHFVFPAGEEHKNLATVSKLYEFLIKNHFDRKDMLIALGGGVTGDLTGFAAATYLRGIDFIQVPTSLLAQVDSSIGGKTGVDFDAYKNMVGAFYMPKLVYININTLKTLSERQFHSGLGEVIKHGLIRDREYFNYIENHKEQIEKRDQEVMARIVEGSCKIKRAVVEEDPKEAGVRALLNYGHTFGHSIEKLMDFSMTHGECVAVGAVLAAFLSKERGYITEGEYASIKELFDYFHFPGALEELSVSDIIKTTKLDKKMEHGTIKFILLDRIGHAGIYRDVSDEEMLHGIEKYKMQGLI